MLVPIAWVDLDLRAFALMCQTRAGTMLWRVFGQAARARPGLGAPTHAECAAIRMLTGQACGGTPPRGLRARTLEALSLS